MKRPHPAPSGQTGSSLVELMMSLVFLSIGLLGVAQMIPTGMYQVEQAQLRTRAVQAAQERLEAIRSSDFDAPELVPGAYSETVGRYTISWTVVDASPVPGSKRIDVAASWGSTSNARTTRLRTYVSSQ
jgi:Tfp pilus assembly protein PilV